MPISRFPFFYNPNYYNNSNIHNRSYYHSQLRHTTTNNSPDYSLNKNIYSYINNTQSNKTQTQENRVLKDDLNKKNNSKSNPNTDSYFFELFGLKLYFDDILLICLIFFLYQEGVKDDELFISLILLLLS